MKSTDLFIKVIGEFLKEKAANEPEFAEKFSNEEKSVEECCNFIMNSVKESGCNGFTDDEVYGIAIHYYDEPNSELNPEYLQRVTCEVVSNHIPELTEEDKREIAKKARSDFYDEQREKFEAEAKEKEERKKVKKKPLAEVYSSQMVFNFDE